MTQVPTLSNYQVTLFHTMNTKARVSDLQVQLATGQKSQTYAGISREALRLVTLETSRTQADQYINNIDKTQQRLKLMENSMEAIDSLAREFRQTLNSALTAPESAGRDLTKLAADMRQMTVDLLNSSDGQSYLFGGTRTDRPPVDLSGYSSISLIQADGVTVDAAFYEDYYTQVQGNALPFAQGSFYEQIYFDKNGVAPAGPLPADPDSPTLTEFTAEDPDLWEYYVDRLDSAEMLAGPKADYYRGNDQANVVRADRNLELDYDVRADLPAFQQILAAFDAVANLPTGDANDPFQREVIAKARSMLDGALSPPAGAGFDGLEQIRVRTSSLHQSVEAIRERHERFSAYAEGAAEEIEGIDKVDVIVRLQSDQQALEASYAVLARLQSLSLLDFI